jgi:hypothetical protein
MPKIYELTIMFFFIIIVNTELLFKIDNIKDGAFEELGKKATQVGKDLGEDSFFTTPVSLTVGDGVGGCDFSSSFLSRFITLNTAWRSLLNRIDTVIIENHQANYQQFSKDLQDGVVADIKSYAGFIEEIFTTNVPRNLTEEDKKEVNLEKYDVSSTLISASIHYDLQNKGYFLHTLQKGDSLGVVFRKVVTGLGNRHGDETYSYLPVFMTNAQQKSGFNSPDQFSSSFPHYIKSKDDVLLFRIQKDDIVILGSDGLFDNLSISFLTFVVNLYVQKSIHPLKFQSIANDVLDVAYDVYVRIMQVKKEAIDDGITEEMEEYIERKKKKIPSLLEARLSKSNTIIPPKNYDISNNHSKRAQQLKGANNAAKRAGSRDPIHRKLDAAKDFAFLNLRINDVKPNNPTSHGQNTPTMNNASVNQAPISGPSGMKVLVNKIPNFPMQQIPRQSLKGKIHPPQKLAPGIKPATNVGQNAVQMMMGQFNKQQKNVPDNSLNHYQSENFMNVYKMQTPSTIHKDFVQPNSFYNPPEQAPKENSRYEQKEADYQSVHSIEDYHQRRFGSTNKTMNKRTPEPKVRPNSNLFGKNEMDEILESLKSVSKDVDRIFDNVTQKEKRAFEEEYLTPMVNNPPKTIEANGNKHRPVSRMSNRRPKVEKLPFPFTMQTNTAKNNNQPSNENDALVNNVQRNSHTTEDNESEMITVPNSNANGRRRLVHRGKESVGNKRESVDKMSFGVAEEQLKTSFMKIKPSVLVDDNVFKWQMDNKDRIINPAFLKDIELKNARPKNERILVGLGDDVKPEIRKKLEEDFDIIAEYNFFTVDPLTMIKEPSDTLQEGLLHSDVIKALGADFSFTNSQIASFTNSFTGKAFSTAIASMTKRMSKMKTYYPAPFIIQARIMLQLNKKIPAIAKEDDITVVAGLVVEDSMTYAKAKTFITAFEKESEDLESDAAEAAKNFLEYLQTLIPKKTKASVEKKSFKHLI